MLKKKQWHVPLIIVCLILIVLSSYLYNPSLTGATVYDQLVYAQGVLVVDDLSREQLNAINDIATVWGMEYGDIAYLIEEYQYMGVFIFRLLDDSGIATFYYDKGNLYAKGDIDEIRYFLMNYQKYEDELYDANGATIENGRVYFKEAHSGDTLNYIIPKMIGIVVLEKATAAQTATISQIAYSLGLSDKAIYVSDLMDSYENIVVFQHFDESGIATVRKQGDDVYIEGDVVAASSALKNYATYATDFSYDEITISGTQISQGIAEQGVVTAPVSAEDILCSQIPYNSMSRTTSDGGVTVYVYNEGLYLCDNTYTDYPVRLEEYGSSYPSISPSKKYVVYIKEGNLLMYSTNTGAKTTISAADYAVVSDDYIAYIKEEGLYVYSIAAAETIEVEEPYSNCQNDLVIVEKMLIYTCDSSKTYYSLGEEYFFTRTVYEFMKYSQNKLIVVSAYAPNSENIVALELAGAYDIPVVTDSDLTAVEDYNLIVIGRSSNSYLAQMLPFGASFEENQAILALVPNGPNTYTLLVTGTDVAALHSAVEALIENNKEQLDYSMKVRINKK